MTGIRRNVVTREHVEQGRLYLPNGPREVARRKRQITAGKLKPSR